MIDFLCYTSAVVVTAPLIATFLTFYTHDDLP
jgi:hypothetical protein